MKKHIHNLAKYTALILISSMPFSLEVVADTEKEKAAILSVDTEDKDLIAIKRRDFKSQDQ